MANATKCAHSACTCAAPTGQAYCSDYCEHTATSGPPREEVACECGHADCRGRREKREAVQRSP